MPVPYGDNINCYIATAVVQRAITYTITDIGQLSKMEKRCLEKAVKIGVLSKGKGGPFHIPKTVYAVKGFDFAAAREAHYQEFLYWHSLDVARGVVSK